MLYWFLKYYVRLVLRIYFGRIYIHGVDHIPKNKPVILASNHPSAFLEPVILACFLQRPLWFLTRGDFFDKTISRIFLESTHQLPIYQKASGFAKLKGNLDVFRACYAYLKKKKTILIFVETRSVLEPRLRPLRLGAGKLAAGAIKAEPDMELYMVPVSVNYSNPLQHGSIAMFHFSDPIVVHELVAEQDTVNRNTIHQINSQLEVMLRKNVAHIDDPKRDATFAILVDMLIQEDKRGFPFLSASDKPRQKIYALAQILSAMPENTYRHLEQRVATYADTLNALSLREDAVSDNRNPLILLIDAIFSIPIFLFGYLAHLLPLSFVKWLTGRIVKRKPFYAPVLIGMSLPVFPAYYLLVGLLLFVVFQLKGLLVLLLIMMSGYFAVKSGIHLKSRLARLYLGLFNPSKIRAARKLREEILQSVYRDDPIASGAKA